jgi:hypothetical protein
MLSDAAVCELAQQLLVLPAAAGLQALDLSRSQLLTWQCCDALGQLLVGQLDVARGGSSTKGLQGAAGGSAPLARTPPAAVVWPDGADGDAASATDSNDSDGSCNASPQTSSS